MNNTASSPIISVTFPVLPSLATELIFSICFSSPISLPLTHDLGDPRFKSASAVAWSLSYGICARKETARLLSFSPPLFLSVPEYAAELLSSMICIFKPKQKEKTILT